jgi:hypothetical protein
MVDATGLVEYGNAVEVVVAAKEVEVMKVVGIAVTLEKAIGVNVALAETGIAELEPVTIEDCRALVEVAKEELLDTDPPVDIEEAAASVEVDVFKAAATSD